MSETRIHAAVLSVDEGGTLSGLLVPYDGTAATRGCFARTIAERASKIRLLVDTGKGRPGVFGDGTELRETDQGLHATFTVPEQYSEVLGQAAQWPATVRIQQVNPGEFKLVDVRLGHPDHQPPVVRDNPSLTSGERERRISVDTARRRLALLDLEDW